MPLILMAAKALNIRMIGDISIIKEQKKYTGAKNKN
jgi:hypothetical protein